VWLVLANCHEENVQQKSNTKRNGRTICLVYYKQLLTQEEKLKVSQTEKIAVTPNVRQCSSKRVCKTYVFKPLKTNGNYIHHMP
jgi:hypothetical protein